MELDDLSTRGLVKLVLRSVNRMEARMTALTDALGRLSEAITGKISALETALAAERERYDALVSSENAEDVAQDAELAAARAETDRTIAEATEQVDALTAQIQGSSEDGSAPAEEPAPAPEQPAETPADTPVDTPAETPADSDSGTSAPQPGDVIPTEAPTTDGTEVSPADPAEEGNPTG